MTRRSMTRNEILALIPELSDEALAVLTEAGIVQPVLGAAEPRFREIDAARLQLAVDLEEIFRLDPEGLALVLSLIDQLNGLKGEMQAVLGALAEEPPETRARLRRVIRETRILRVQGE
ncbi:chaperone modulator CbpM [Paracoccus sp. (in: a-proteobacteria)]|uniref:chaperone modulator CbpM n=1 Tax=Paracoccus sp. TaxID=267 RepID=UPI0026DF4DC2|nr:chaperone modulator CbpM [Paracoccus sp. (in: a-proteobacteria)]MDO5371504.1 chaperone modulator CbpM [Paracoccus sp. (in: a-proteobacteria)]